MFHLVQLQCPNLFRLRTWRVGIQSPEEVMRKPQGHHGCFTVDSGCNDLDVFGNPDEKMISGWLASSRLVKFTTGLNIRGQMQFFSILLLFAPAPQLSIGTKHQSVSIFFSVIYFHKQHSAQLARSFWSEPSGKFLCGSHVKS